MADTQDDAASEAGRQLVRRRWGDQVLRRAVATVVERQDQLDDTQRAALREISGDDDG